MYIFYHNKRCYNIIIKKGVKTIMHVFHNNSYNQFKNLIKKDIYKVFNKEIKKRRNISNIEDWEKYKKNIMKIFSQAFPKEIFEREKNINSKLVSKYEFEHFIIENVLIESLKGWFVNATVYIPKKKGKYNAIVCPTGHSSKTLENYVKSNQALARNGYITISFDPPGMRGEHIKGNDHFTDGVLSFLSGFWSNTYFVIDALRCIDYLETRDDVIKEGYGMTGISGGGTTTIYASIIDSRIKASAPVCCVSNAIHKLLEENYTTCPETVGYNYYKYAIDSEMMLNLIAPKPLLLVGGEKDEVFDYKLAIKSMQYVKQTYKLYDKEEDANYYMDKEASHEYSLNMVEQVVIFFNKYLKNTKEKPLKLIKKDILLIEEAKLLCNPKDTISFRSNNQKMFINKKRNFTVQDIIKSFYNNPPLIKSISEEKSNTKWFHSISKTIYKINKNYELPAIVLKRENQKIEDVLLFFTDDGKWKHFKNEGFLSKLGGFLNKTPIIGEKNIISVDLSGFGELELEGDGYDLANWCNQLRNISYLLLFNGESIMEYRIKEIMAILKYIEKTKQYKNIYIAGMGKATIPTLIASYMYGKCEKTTLINGPISFETLVKYVPNDYLPDSVIYNAPERFEIYEIANKMTNIELINPRNGDFSINKEQVKLLYNNANIKYFKENNYEL